MTIIFRAFFVLWVFITPQFAFGEVVKSFPNQIKVAVLKTSHSGEIQFLTFTDQSKAGAWFFVTGETIQTSLGMNRIRSVFDTDKSKVHKTLQEMLQIDYSIFWDQLSQLSLWGEAGQINDSLQMSETISRTHLEKFLEKQLKFEFVTQTGLDGLNFSARGRSCKVGAQGVLRRFNTAALTREQQEKDVLGILECISFGKTDSNFKLLFPKKISGIVGRLVIEMLPDRESLD